MSWARRSNKSPNWSCSNWKQQIVHP